MSMYFDDEYQTLDQWLADAESLMVRLGEAIESPGIHGGGEFIKAHARAELAAMVLTFERVQAGNQP